MAISKKNYPLSVTLSLIDKATAPLDAFNARVQMMTAPFRNLNNRLRVLGEASGLRKLGGAVGDLGNSFSNVAARAAGLFTQIAVGATLVGGSLLAAVKSAADYGDEIDEASQKTGIAADQLQRLRYAAQFSSITAEDLNSTLAKFNRNTVEAATGSRQMEKWFSRAGVTVKDMRGKLKPTDVLIADIAEKFKTMPDGARKTALAMGLFGKTGATLIPFLNEGRAGLAELFAEADKVGAVMSDISIKESAEFNDSWDRTTAAIKGVLRVIGSELMPVIRESVGGIREWIIANKGLVEVKVREWIQLLVKKIPELKEGIKEAWQQFLLFKDQLMAGIDYIGGIGNAFKILGAIMAGPLLLAIVSLGSAFAKLGLVILSTPIGWILTAIALVGAAIYATWNKPGIGIGWIFGELLPTAIGDAIDWARSAGGRFVDALWSGIKAGWSVLKSGFGALLDGLMPSWAKSLYGIGAGNQSTPGTSGAVPATTSLMQATGIATGSSTGAAGLTPRIAAGPQQAPAKSELKVSFENVPQGTQVKTKSQNQMIDLSLGYSMAAG